MLLPSAARLRLWRARLRHKYLSLAQLEASEPCGQTFGGDRVRGGRTRPSMLPVQAARKVIPVGLAETSWPQARFRHPVLGAQLPTKLLHQVRALECVCDEPRNQGLINHYIQRSKTSSRNLPGIVGAPKSDLELGNVASHLFFDPDYVVEFQSSVIDD
jgi:hypothetical protein